MDFTAHKASLLAWYIEMAGTPGWKAQAWHSVNTLAQQHRQFYGDLPALLTAAMKEKANDSPDGNR